MGNFLYVKDFQVRAAVFIFPSAPDQVFSAALNIPVAEIKACQPVFSINRAPVADALLNLDFTQASCPGAVKDFTSADSGIA